ncbi:MAG TPA: dTDP-4-dehydrorhamnose 3,5-epimerase [Polyangiaceae bacterium]|jgi:dTDP-4-dehydrorhamnose 3,5-epimerase
MDVTRLPLSGLTLIKPSVFRDARGFFLESYSQPRYAELGIDCVFVQDNHSHSVGGTLRGLHYQSRPGQAKLVRVASGRIFDVAVDIRPSSKTFGKWHAVTLDAEEHAQLFVPVGFAHGFCVISESADVLYKVSTPYQPDTECTLAWKDPDLGIDWPVDTPLVSRRDEQGEAFSEFRRRAEA